MPGTLSRPLAVSAAGSNSGFPEAFHRSQAGGSRFRQRLLAQHESRLALAAAGAGAGAPLAGVREAHSSSSSAVADLRGSNAEGQGWTNGGGDDGDGGGYGAANAARVAAMSDGERAEALAEVEVRGRLKGTVASVGWWLCDHGGCGRVLASVHVVAWAVACALVHSIERGRGSTYTCNQLSQRV